MIFNRFLLKKVLQKCRAFFLCEKLRILQLKGFKLCGFHCLMSFKRQRLRAGF